MANTTKEININIILKITTGMKHHLLTINIIMIMRFLEEKTGLLTNHIITIFLLPVIITINKTQEALQVKIFKGNIETFLPNSGRVIL